MDLTLCLSSSWSKLFAKMTKVVASNARVKALNMFCDVINMKCHCINNINEVINKSTMSFIQIGASLMIIKMLKKIYKFVFPF